MPAGSIVGSIYAEAELNIDKFKAAAAQMGTDASRIVSAMDKAGAGLEKAQANLDGLKASLDAANIQANAAKAAWASSAQALQEMQEKAEAAAIKAADLGKIYEDTAQKFGEGSAAAYIASRDYDDASKAADELANAVDNQQAKVLKSQAAFKKAEAAVRKYSGQISTAESDIKKFNDQIAGMNKSLEEAVLDDYTGDVDSASMSTEAFNDILNALENKGLRGLGSAVSSAVGQLSLFKNATGVAGVGLTAIQRGLTSVIGALSPATVGVAALTAAAGYGAYKFYDYASGAAAAREALEKLNTTAQEWQETNATTRFEQSAGLKSFGLSEDDFAPAISNSEDWLDTLVKVWTDGKVETDDIVREMVDGFTANTETLRTRMEELQTQAQKAGVSGTGLFGDMDTDLARLDELDAQVEALLKKRQNGFLTDDEISALQTMLDERGAIEVKYHLVEDQTGGFNEIVQGVEAAMSRGADAGDVLSDAFASASQGIQAFNDALNAEYDAQYRIISMLDDGSEKQAALSQLQIWYNEQAANGVQAYYDALKSATEETDAFSATGEYADTIDQLASAVNAMYAATENPTDTNISAFADSIAELDETQVIELTAALMAMQSAAVQSGEEMDSSLSSILSNIFQLKSAVNTPVFADNESLYSSLQSMFGENLDTEVLEINAALNTEILDSTYNAWASGEHSDIIPSVAVDTIETELSSMTIDGLTGTVTAVTSGGVSLDISQILLDPITGTVTAVTSDGKVLSMSNVLYDNLTGYVTMITDEGQDVSIELESLQSLEGVVTRIVEGDNVERPKLELEGSVTVTSVDFSEGAFSNSQNAALEYVSAAAKVNIGSGGSLVEGDFVNAVNRYVEATEELKSAQETLQGIDMYGDIQGYMDASSAVDAAKESLTSAGQAILALSEDSESFNTAVQYVTNGLQMLSDGSLSEDDAAGLMEFIRNLQTVMDEIGASDIGNDLMSGIAEGLKSYGWDVDAATVASAVETALRSALQTHSPSTLTQPIGTDVTAGVGEGMRDTSSIDAAGVIVSEAAADALLARIDSAYSIGVNFDAGFARGILGGKSRVISAAANVASAALSAAKAKLQIASPSKVTEEFGEYFDMGFIEGIANMAPRIDDAVERAISIDPPAWVTNGQAYAQEPSVVVMSSPIDYDRIAQAIRDGGMTMECDGKKFAEITTDDTARAQNNRSRRMAIGYGKR